MITNGKLKKKKTNKTKTKKNIKKGRKTQIIIAIMICAVFPRDKSNIQHGFFKFSVELKHNKVFPLFFFAEHKQKIDLLKLHLFWNANWIYNAEQINHQSVKKFILEKSHNNLKPRNWSCLRALVTSLGMFPCSKKFEISFARTSRSIVHQLNLKVLVISFLFTGGEFFFFFSSYYSSSISFFWNVVYIAIGYRFKLKVSIDMQLTSGKIYGH